MSAYTSTFVKPSTSGSCKRDYQRGHIPDARLRANSNCNLLSGCSCLDHPIPPCRSLCTAVQQSCETTMRKYGYPWPTIVKCDQFPVDNDMCIMAQHAVGGVIGEQTTRRPPATTPQSKVNGEKRKRKRKKNRKEHHVDKHTGHRIRNHHENGRELASFGEDLTGKPVHHHLQPLPLPSMSHKLGENVHSKVARSEPSSHNQADSRQSLHNMIMSRVCHSQWSLKARATSVTRTRDGELVMKLRNHRVLHGELRQPGGHPVEITVPANLTQELESRGLNDELDTRKRYYLMGTTVEGGANIATLAIPWPHKMGQFR